jgi:hypothetical protein
VTEENLFDAAWEQWRRDLTKALTPASGDGTDTQMWQALQDVGAIDAADGYIRREWGLGLMTSADDQLRPLRMSGMNDEAVRALVALVQRHPTPAAGG